MTKVMTVMLAIVVLILGTALGVAVSASHLSEKELLSAGDVQLALASQGLLAIPDWGDHSDLSIDGVTPVVYKVDEMQLVVYAFADASQQENVMDSAEGHRGTYQVLSVGTWRNLYVGYLSPLPGHERRDEQISQEESAEIDAEFRRIYPKIERLQGSLLNIFSDMQEKTITAATEQMIYTIEQRSCCTPISIDGQTMYECWVAFQPISCQYKEPPIAEELPVKVYFEAISQGSKMTMTNTGGQRWNWNGKGQLDWPVSEHRYRFLTKRPDSIHYRIIFERGGLQEEVMVTGDLGGV